MRSAVILCMLVALSILNGCARIAVSTAPAMQPSTLSPQAEKLAAQFWDDFHHGNYRQIDELLEHHMQLLANDPHDALTVAHTGWLHAWKVAERTRGPRTARILEDIALAEDYFDQAVGLDPAEARYLGFAASFELAQGAIMKNERLQRAGYFRMKDAIAMWPEFNLFTSGYSMSSGDVHSAPFQEGLEQQWETLDRCFDAKVGRSAPNLTQYLGKEIHTGPKRACWDSWIAPHNWEGFFLNFGDMLARAGDLPNARTMYQAAKLSKTYDQWPFRAVLERRLERLDALSDILNHAADGEPEWTPMAGSAFACMGCHQTLTPTASNIP